MADGKQRNLQEFYTMSAYERLKMLMMGIKDVSFANPPPLRPVGCIFYLREVTRLSDMFAYTPQLFSFGPLHHGRENVRLTEAYKIDYVRSLLTRALRVVGSQQQFEEALDECIVSFESMEEQARRWYEPPINLSSHEFGKIMVIDGLFIIELFLRHAKKYHDVEDEPFLKSHSIMNLLAHDLILIENQLPMAVLNYLSAWPLLEKMLRGTSITELALIFFNQFVPTTTEEDVLARCSGFQAKTLLELLGMTLNPPPVVSDYETKEWTLMRRIPSVTELKLAGVEIKKGSSNYGSLNIKFSEGVLEIPPVTLQLQTATLFKNLIIYEYGAAIPLRTHIIPYVSIMGSLITSSEDAEVLYQLGIIKNDLPRADRSLCSNRCLSFEVFSFFKSFSWKPPCRFFSYAEICDEVNAYCKKNRQQQHGVFRKCMHAFGLIGS